MRLRCRGDLVCNPRKAFLVLGPKIQPLPIPNLVILACRVHYITVRLKLLSFPAAPFPGTENAANTKFFSAEGQDSPSGTCRWQQEHQGGKPYEIYLDSATNGHVPPRHTHTSCHHTFEVLHDIVIVKWSSIMHLTTKRLSSHIFDAHHRIALLSELNSPSAEREDQNRSSNRTDGLPQPLEQLLCLRVTVPLRPRVRQPCICSQAHLPILDGLIDTFGVYWPPCVTEASLPPGGQNSH